MGNVAEVDMKKPIKNIYMIDATNKRVYVRYISEEYYEDCKKQPGRWNVVGEVGPKGLVFRQFTSGVEAEAFILEQVAEYETKLKEWEMATAAARKKAIADNDNYAKLIQEEQDWRIANMNGKVFK